MWTSVYMTQNIEIARELRVEIEKHSIPVMIHQIKSGDANGVDCFELLVPSAELCEALEIIIG